MPTAPLEKGSHQTCLGGTRRAYRDEGGTAIPKSEAQAGVGSWFTQRRICSSATPSFLRCSVAFLRL